MFRARIGALCLLGLAAVFSLAHASAQEANADRASALLKALDSRQDLPEAAKEQIRQRLQKSLSLFTDADDFAAKAGGYRKAVETSTRELARLRKETEDLPAPESAISEVKRSTQNATAESLSTLLARERADLENTDSQVRALTTQILQEEERPGAIPALLKSVRQELDQVENGPSKETSSAISEADQILWAAWKRSAESRQAALEKELSSYDIRHALLVAQKEKYDRLLGIARARLQFAEKARADKVQAEARLTLEQANLTITGDGHPALVKVAEEMRQLTGQLAAIGTALKEIPARRKLTEDALAHLQDAQNALDAQPDSPGRGAGSALSQILLEERLSLPNLLPLKKKLAATDERLSGLRIEGFRTRRQIATAKIPENEASDVLSGYPPDEHSDSTRKRLVKLLEARMDLLGKIQEERTHLIRDLSAISIKEAKFTEQLQHFSALLDRRLFWVPSAPPLGFQTLKELPDGVHWLLGPQNLRPLSDAIFSSFRARTLPALAAVTAIGILLATRRRMSETLKETGRRIRKISSDHFIETCKALLISAALATPIPLALGFFGWMLTKAQGGSEWVSALGASLLPMPFLLAPALLLFEVARPDGLGDAHFQWPKSSLALLRRSFLSFIPLALLAGVAQSMTLFGTEGQSYRHSLGQVAFCLMMLCFGAFLYQVFDPNRGVFAPALASRKDKWVYRLSPIWHKAVLVLPLALVALAASGYFYTALDLRPRVSRSFQAIALAAIGYGMVYRWFLINERKLALANALAERRARTQAGNPDSPQEPEEPPIDIASITAQSRTLLRFFLFLLIALSLWPIWSDLIPRLEALDSIRILGLTSVGALLRCATILFVTVLAARNLPGILEIALLQKLPIQAGSRYAISTLCQYGVVAVGIYTTARALGLEAANLSWIAAALGVGIGFGLQEIVANFVCGLILLFERPIRIGDIVTVQNMSGVVSRIRIRATTILNWDKQEFLVPNKEFITGCILNWTLSNSMNRIVISVGVAYGSDTDRAREILKEIARTHPKVLADPPPSVTFDSFGDSALALTLRCYLSDVDSRLPTISEINTEVHRRFAAEGIEIPFPKRDVNLTIRRLKSQAVQ